MSAVDTPPRTGDVVPATADDADARLARIEAQLEFLIADARRRDAELEPLRDLAAEVGVMSTPVLDALTERVATLDDRGYLRFVRSSAGVLDRVVTAFDEDDVEALGDNIVLILETLRDLTQPELMHLLQRTASAAQEQAHVPAGGPPPSTLALLRELRDPEVRRGLGRMLDLLRRVGSEEPPA
jgi:uncharacterized protein YjgD (DUF1641 family)